ncbi:MAG: hypothetical protein GY758_17805 [Fuerstiella sp.]|nr:hypothetical protein [Fuerstiella sp.]MCP4783985.1 hypothetical protein [Fuerstiella sp.]MCP4857257.1 hypothetical protein [Fuerstiella sp.]
MFRTPILLLLFVCTCGPATAQTRQFPYKARVVVEQTYVRSGGGEAFYPTAELRRDATVTVRRHDPGGWYMIDPPKGSFSWIPSKHTRRLSSDSAEVLESNVVVFVGSSFGDETHVWQRRMMAGEKVTVLGEQQVDTLSGPKQMLKIAPPKREYRWLPGSAVIPVGDTARADHDRNPYAVPSNAIRPRPQQHTVGTEAEPQHDNSSVSPSKQLLKLKQIREEQRQLQAIDQRFRDMIVAPPSKWKLDAVEADYRELQNGAKYKPVAGQIDLRYPAIKRYRLRKAEWDDLDRLTSETEKRDSELLATQFNLPPITTSQMITNQQFVGGPQPPVFGPQLQPIPEHSPLPFPSIPNETTIGSTTPGLTVPGVPEGPQSPTTKVGNNGASSIPASSRYIGAGVIQRGTGTEQKTYLLTSSSGKVLAHLTSTESVSLEKFVGKAVGLHGKRWFEDKTQHDAIEVSGVEAVRIRQ